MPTFVVGSGVGDNYATLLLSLPDVDWMKAAIMGALYQLTVTGDWREEGDVATSFAVEEASQMVAGYRFMNFNPFPVGMILPYASETPPPAYLMCDGSEYTQDQYPELFTAISDVWKYDGIYFQTPDLRGRFVMQFDEDTALGVITNNNVLILNDGQLASHTHYDAGHVHTIPLTSTSLAVAPGELPVVIPVPLFTDVTGVGNADIGYTGDNAPIDNRPSFVTLNYVMYAGRI